MDAHVGQHLFEECILNLKRLNKIVVLVTNALQFLKHSSNIVVLKDGKVSEEGECVMFVIVLVCEFIMLFLCTLCLWEQMFRPPKRLQYIAKTRAFILP